MKKLIPLISVLLASCASAPSLQIPLATRQAEPSPIASSAITATIDVAPTIQAYEAQAAEAAVKIAEAQAAQDEAERQLYNQQVAIDSGNLTVAAITHEVYQTNVAIESTSVAYRPTADWMLVLRVTDSGNQASIAKTNATADMARPTQTMLAQMSAEYVGSETERSIVRRVGYFILFMLGLATLVYLVVMIVRNAVEAEAISNREKQEVERATRIPNLSYIEPLANATEQDEETSAQEPENVKQARFVVPCHKLSFFQFCTEVVKRKTQISRDAMVNISVVFTDTNDFERFRAFAQSRQWIRAIGTGIYAPTDAGMKIFTAWLEDERLPEGYVFQDVV